MPNKLSRFWQELRRRHVTKVIIWYAGVAMVLIGLASDVAGPFNLPDGTLRMVIILLIVGFPLTFLLSWMFDITPEGSIRKDGNKIRITAQLIRVDDGSHLWSETYNRKLKDIFSIQEMMGYRKKNKLNISTVTKEQVTEWIY
jgi:hypothetical protein